VCVRIHDGNYSAIGWSVFPFEWKTGFFATAPENQFADTGADRINCHHWFSCRTEMSVERLDNKQRPALQRFVLYGGDDSADYAGELHVEFGTLASCGASSGTSHIYSVNHADDSRINWHILHSLGKSGTRPGYDEHSFVKTSPDRIDGHDISGRVATIDVSRTDDKQFFPD
jgi:hypothetical protein